MCEMLFTEKEKAGLLARHYNSPSEILDVAVAAVIARLAAGVSVEPVADEKLKEIIESCLILLSNYSSDQDPRFRSPGTHANVWGKDLVVICREVESLALSQLQTALAAAGVQENERIAHWYEVAGYYLDEEDVPDAIRALLGKEAQS